MSEVILADITGGKCYWHLPRDAAMQKKPPPLPPPRPSKAYPAPNVSTAEVGKACGVRCRHHVGGNVTGLDVARLSVSLLQAALLF